MRPDMRKVLTERPRYGPRLKDPKGYKKQLQRELAYAQDFTIERKPDGVTGVVFVYEHEAESDPARRESMRKKWKASFGHKTFNDHLEPIHKLLVKNAGRQWSDVWSEVCEHADERSTSGHHLREHVWRYVEHHAEKEDDVVYGPPRWSSVRPELRPGDLYVDPATGALAQYRPEASRKNYWTKLTWNRIAPVTPPPKRVQAGPLRQYQLVNNCWFELLLEEVPPKGRRLSFLMVRDAFLRRMLSFGSEEYSPDETACIQAYGFVGNGNKLVYCTKKRQLSKSEIRKAGLKR